MAQKWFVRVVLILFLIEILLPIISLVIFNLDLNFGNLTFEAYKNVFVDSDFWLSVLRSFIISIVTVALTIVVVTPALWYTYLYFPRLYKILQGLSFIPFMLPDIVLSLGYVQFFSKPPLSLTGTPYLLPFAFTLLGLPYFVLAVHNRLRLMDAKTYHDAALSLGSSSFHSWWRVQLPLLKTGVINGSILVFSVAFAEFTITLLTTGGSFVNIAIHMRSTFKDSPLEGGVIALLTLLISVVAILISLFVFSPNRKVEK